MKNPIYPNETYKMRGEIKEHLLRDIIPFWLALKDVDNGGFYGYVGYGRDVDKQAEKGCILNSRILWFFSNCYLLYKDGLLTDADLAAEDLKAAQILAAADHAFDFMRSAFLDKINGGVLWSVSFDGKALDTTKHTYNQAFAVYSLASYYRASGNKEALGTACMIYDIIESRCKDDKGYLEAFNIDFTPAGNDKLSENGVMADKTMNTLLHVMEAYTELYKATEDVGIRGQMIRVMEIFKNKIYNPRLRRQEVFFDEDYNSIIDLHSYGHDIETSWLLDRTLEVIGDPSLTRMMEQISDALSENIYETAFDGRSLANECDKGVVNNKRVWWVQAETVIGFLNAYAKHPDEKKYIDAVLREWEFIRDFQIDHRGHPAEWYGEIGADGRPDPTQPLADPWKCPYHNGRMCIEVIRRLEDI